MIWGEDEPTPNNLPSASSHSPLEIDRLITECRMLRQEVRELRELTEQRPTLGSPSAITPPALDSKAVTDPETVLLFFTATWCGPCQQMNPIIHRLKREGFPIQVVDVDREPDKTSKFGVSSIPFFQLVVAGKPADKVSGITTADHLRKMMNPRAESTQIDPLREYRGKVSSNLRSFHLMDWSTTLSPLKNSVRTGS
jgi:thiol-disulfide isomerase/thioredoxin